MKIDIYVKIFVHKINVLNNVFSKMPQRYVICHEYNVKNHVE